MKIESKRFGTIEVKEDRVLTLKGGLLGFSNMTNFVLVDDRADTNHPFKWLVSLDDPECGFLVTDPGIFFSDYVFDLSEEDRQAIGAETEDDILVITLLTVPANPKEITANLRGPLVFNSNTRNGKQIVLANSGYATKHYIFLQAKDSNATEAETTADNAIFPAAMAMGASANTEVKTQS